MKYVGENTMMVSIVIASVVASGLIIQKLKKQKKGNVITFGLVPLLVSPCITVAVLVIRNYL